MQRTTSLLLILLALMWLDLTVSKAVYEGQLLHYNPVNGDFQAYNPLRRMAAGQAPGKDFQPYMGLGVTYVTYLPFKLMGETFSASKFSAQLMHMWLFGFGSFILFLLMRMERPMALGLAFITQVYAYACTDYLFMIPPRWMITEVPLPFAQTFYALSHAENSCLGIRVALPFITAGLMLLVYRKWPGLLNCRSSAARGCAPGRSLVVTSFLRSSGTKEAMLWGLMAGAQVPWSNDFGFASMAALSFVYLVFRWRLNPSLTSLLAHVVAMAFGFISILTIATHGYPLRWVHYNFGGVAKDQFWYFMPDDADKVFSLMQYVRAKRIFILTGISAAFTAGIFFALLRQRKSDIRDILFVYILGCSLAAGVLSTIGGGIMERYFAASLRLLPFAALFVLLKFVKLPKWENKVLVLALLCGVGFYVAFQPVSFRSLKEDIRVRTAGRFFYSDWAGGYLSNTQKAEIALAKQMKHRRVFSTYSSLMDAASGNFQPSHIDYIIHALGRKNRREYLQSFAASKADFVTTPNEYWTLWETWSRRVNWWFYRQMLRQYEPVASTLYHVVWKKRVHPVDVTKRNGLVQCRLQDHVLNVTDALPPGTYYIELTVAQHSSLVPSGVPIIGNRALLTVEEQSSGFNAVMGKGVSSIDVRTYNVDYTLSPQVLVVEHKAGSPSQLKLRLAPKDRAALYIDSCNVTGVYDFPTAPRPH